jgi:hypothetical protein
VPIAPALATRRPKRWGFAIVRDGKGWHYEIAAVDKLRCEALAGRAYLRGKVALPQR